MQIGVPRITVGTYLRNRSHIDHVTIPLAVEPTFSLAGESGPIDTDDRTSRMMSNLQILGHVDQNLKRERDTVEDLEVLAFLALTFRVSGQYGSSIGM